MIDSKKLAPPISKQALAIWVVLFLAVYFIASFCDLWSTAFALGNPEAAEANIAATTNGQFDLSKAWLITAAGGVFLSFMVVFALRNLESAKEYWVNHPVAALRKISLLPWLERDRGRSAINSLNYALAFPILRFAASINNVMIGYGERGLFDYAIVPLNRFLPHSFATALVVLVAFWLLAVLVSPLGRGLMLNANVLSPAAHRH